MFRLDITWFRIRRVGAAAFANGLLCGVAAAQAAAPFTPAAITVGTRTVLTAAPAPYMDPSLPVATRVADLVGRMTLAEKTAQLYSSAPAIARLGVPAYEWWNEGLHGVGIDGIATVFPQAIGLAATWDTPLHKAVAGVISTEGRAHNADARAHNRVAAVEGLTFWSPNINIFRDPRWGRGQETYGEDPFLTARFGVAFIQGMQGDDPRYLKVAATAKHFAAHSGPEPLRHKFDAHVSLHDLADTYLPAFRAATTEAGVSSVMCSYNAINSAPSCANPYLLNDRLRKAWHFQGLVVSDCAAITDIDQHQRFTKTRAESAGTSLKAGTDLDCDFVNADKGSYQAAVAAGLATEGDVDTALRRLFAVRFRLGEFDPPRQVKYASITMRENDTEDHRRLARRAADESIVLLKNDAVLPLRQAPRSIAVIGPLADTVTPLLGSYNGMPSHAVTVLQGLRQRFPASRITYHAGTEFLVTPNPVTQQFLSTNEGEPGVTAEYFRNMELAGPAAVTRVDAQVSLGLNGAHLPTEVSQAFSVRWTGRLTAATGGQYEISFINAINLPVKLGGLRVWVDGVKVIDSWMGRPGAAESPRVATVHLDSGKPVPLRVEYSRPALPMSPLIADSIGAISMQWRRTDGTLQDDALQAVRNADLVVAAVGITPELENEEKIGQKLPEGFSGGDRTSLDLPAPEQSLLEAAGRLGKPLVVVLLNGGALSVNWAAEHTNALLEAWYPGEEGGSAIAGVLAGDTNPAGRLPVTVYRDVGDLPAFTDYAMQGRTYRYFKGNPLFPFGFGLSYSTFRYGPLHVSSRRVDAGKPVSVDVVVTNTGRLPGDEVAELYLSFPPGTDGAPLRALRGFQRFHLAAGASRKLHLALRGEDLLSVDSNGVRRIAAGDYGISVGGGQPGTTQAISSARFAVRGTVELPD